MAILNQNQNDFITNDNNQDNYAGKMNEFENYGVSNNNYEVAYDESFEKKNSFNNIKNYYYNNKFIFLFVLIFLILVIGILILTSNRKGTINELVVDIPEIVYIGEEYKITASVNGKGKLEKTQFLFSVSNDSLILKDNSLSGIKVENQVNAAYSSNVLLTVKASLRDIEKTSITNVLVCKKFEESSIILDSLKLKKEQKISLSSNLNLGDSRCASNIKFTSSNSSVLSIDENGFAVALKTGNVNVVVSDGSNEYSFKINISK